MLLECLERDVPILCEKPLTPDAPSSWEVLEAEQRLGKKRIQVGFMRRFDAEYQRLRGIIASGELGELLMLHCAHRNPDTPPGFTNEMLINDSVVHEFDVIRYLTGDEIKNVQVRLGRASAMPPLVSTIRSSTHRDRQRCAGRCGNLRECPIRLPGRDSGCLRKRYREHW